ncbi:MAG: hypothetical protein HDR14_09870 [Lachnospiraceae bacterium]|nr:hypothetical protein [Lachnospiraceae bacterium]
MADKDRKSICTHKQEADYRKLIAEKVDRISNEKFMQFLYGLLEAFERKWGLS